jgi:hypothetical protein
MQVARRYSNLDPHSGPVQRFAAELRLLRAQVGNPGFRQMGQRVYRAHSSLSEAASGKRLPTWDTAEAFINACGMTASEEVGLWHAKWQQARTACAVNDLLVLKESGQYEAQPESPAAPTEQSQTAASDGEAISVRRSRANRILVAAGAVFLITVAILLLQSKGSNAPLGDLATCDDVGAVGPGRIDPIWGSAFSRAYLQAGGQPELGCPRADDPSGFVHGWGAGISQDLQGGRSGNARIMVLPPHRVLVMSGSYWVDYTQGINGKGYYARAAAIMGYPTSDPTG